jgi:hypothetical protein
MAESIAVEAQDVPEFSETKDMLDQFRLGKETGQDGKPVTRPTHLVNRDIVAIVRKFMLDRGEFFRSPTPMYFDRVKCRVINVVPGDGELRRVLRHLGFMPKEAHTAMVEASLVDMAAIAPERDLHHISYMSDSAIYINAGLGRMIRITEAAIEEVPLGTDDVILLDPEINDWPAFEELSSLIDELRPTVAESCTQLHPDLPLTQHLTTRWSLDSRITPEQAHQAFITRFLFIYSAASKVKTWCAQLFTGEQGSGKSTAIELSATTIYGKISEGSPMPTTVGDLQLSATTSSILALDNIDGANLDAPRNAAMADTLCLIATGGHAKRRRLFTTATVDSYSLRTHLMMTSRAWPLDRDDFARRTLRFEVEPSRGHQIIEKGTLFKALLANRTRILAEVLLRCQNILKAYQAPAPTVPFSVEMAEYEQYTYQCAAYEGSLESTKQLWQAINNQGKATLTETSPIVQAMRLFIGKRSGHAKRIGITELFAVLQTAFHETGQNFPYRAANKLGVHLRNSGPSLAAIGITVGRDNNSSYVLIEPTSEEIARCVSMYLYLRNENLNRMAPYLAQPHKPDNNNIVDEEANRSMETMFNDDLSDMEFPVKGAA